MAVSFQQLGRRERTRLITISVLRTSVSVALLLIIYAVFPIEPLASTETVTRLLIALGILALVIGLQLQAIMSANYPQLRAIEAVVVAVTVFIVLFALLYVGLAEANPANFTRSLDRISAFYFTVTILSTVGFGDIAADTDLARLVVTVQMLLDLTLLAIVVRVFFGAARSGAAARTE
jgi:voltage-gated potassium channel